MKKVLVGLGIGCGVLIIVGIVGVVAGGYWLKKKSGPLIEMSRRAETQKAEFAHLNEEFPFTAPVEGELMKLDEARLLDYLAVRESALPAYRDFEAKAKSEGERLKQGGDRPKYGEALGAGVTIAGLVIDVRDAYLKGLRDKGMSPREFAAITAAVYGTRVRQGMQQVAEQAPAALAQVDESIRQMEEQLKAPGLTPEQRQAFEENLKALRESRATLESSAAPAGDSAVVTANAALLDQHTERIESLMNNAFDLFAVEEDWSKSMQSIVPNKQS